MSAARATAGRALRSSLYRTTSSAAKCWACVALPPLPKTSVVRPESAASATSAAARATAGPIVRSASEASWARSVK